MDSVISLQELHDELAGANPPVVVDVRRPDRFAAGHVPGALNIQVRDLHSLVERVPRDRPVVTY